MKLFVVKYTGPFGFIKPWTAVRDSETFSQQFLTPSILAGIERKLFPELLKEDFGIYRIKAHRLSYEQINSQQEQIQTRGWNSTRQGKQFLFDRPKAIILRGVLLNPTLHLAFEQKEYAEIASQQHVCLCRNEDILYPENIIEIGSEEFDNDEERFAGFELVPEKSDKSFLVGYNRLNNNEPMYGWLKTVGNPVKEY